MTPIPAHPATIVRYVKSADLMAHLDAAGEAFGEAPDEWMLKAGRVLSNATRTRLGTHPATLRSVADDMDELFANADAPKEGAKATDIELELIRARQLYGVPI
jgi:hypothetical protein